MKETKRKNGNQGTIPRGRKRQSGAQSKVSKRKMCILNDQALLLPPKKSEGTEGYGICSFTGRSVGRCRQ